ncbi:putative Serine/arginine-rich splicing factor 12 [Hypsibius exemplaris]|uniref:Serine/arginine-rich splicing factor 12 n=1 Tax=Hypsibius exemplaris TaxID=2072580 RepID=A0A9X6RLA9_HYPEX|nr:putative Serine/arginine-rich splicing factor 12 [Hypsibius exemplaris]
MSRRSRGVSLHISGVADHVRTEDLYDRFGKYGQLLDVYIPLDYYSRRRRGIAYIQFAYRRDAEEAIYYLDRTRILGQEVGVHFAEGERQSSAEMRRRFAHDHASNRRDRSYSRSRGRGRRSRSRSAETTKRRRSITREPSAGAQASENSSRKSKGRSSHDRKSR